MKLISTTALALPLLVLGSAPQTVLAEDATVVAPEHYKVEFENDKVRVIRVTYGPGEESALHEHRDAVVVNLTDLSVQFTMADGTKPAVALGKRAAPRGARLKCMRPRTWVAGQKLC